MGIEGVGDGTVEVEVYAGADTVGGHEGGVFLHFVFGVIVFFFFVPAGCGGLVVCLGGKTGGRERNETWWLGKRHGGGLYHSYLSSPSLLAPG